MGLRSGQKFGKGESQVDQGIQGDEGEADEKGMTMEKFRGDENSSLETESGISHHQVKGEHYRTLRLDKRRCLTCPQELLLLAAVSKSTLRKITWR